ncbi:hypothetical protein [Asticcacaulis sp.]|uniref:hypothetical protein n=1 Tax=Asticcacaulis sp. TaxID=1872648 RepID=UPI0031D8FFC8
MKRTVLRPALIAAVCVLSACDAPDSKTTDIASRTASGNTASGGIEIIDPVAASASVSRTKLETLPATEAEGPVACSTDIGAKAAERLAKTCQKVSPATHPPCNVANSCALMSDEIARSCALFDEKDAPIADCQPDPKSGQAAAAVVSLYYSAINARDYGTAWSQWGEDGPPNQSLPQFSAGFTDTQSTKVTIGDLPEGDAGAGSVFQSVPVTIDAVLKTGGHQRFKGSYTLRRVNDVDGATPAQRRWHIESAKLAPVR